MLLLVLTVNADEEANIRGPVSKVIDEEEYTWGQQAFPGLFYDIDKQLGNELIRVRITNDNELQEDVGITYDTSRQFEVPKFKELGSYYSIGFLGDKYFAGYSEDSYLYKKSGRKDLLGSGLISKILVDCNDETPILYRGTKWLDEGYELTFYDLDKNNRAFIILKKDGIQVDSGIVEPYNNTNAIFIYKGDNDKEIVTLAVHFKNCLFDSKRVDRSLLICDGIFQISDSIINLNDESFNRMKLLYTTNDEIVMALKEDISLTRSKDFPLMGNIWLRTADQHVSPTNPLRFCIYKKVEEPGLYEIRGPVAPLINGENIWNAEEFAGLYYDLDNNIKTEEIRLRITRGNQLEKAKGIEYRTHTQNDIFQFRDWGRFLVLGFLSNKYFAGYLEDGYLYNKSIEDDVIITNLMQYDNLSKVLIDSDDNICIKSNQNLTLMEGYKLFIKSIDIDGNKIYLVLYKDGNAVDSKIVQPSKSDATIEEKTYYYKHHLKNSRKDLITIAVHFENSFLSVEGELASINGIWQISEDIDSIRPERAFGWMKIDEKTDNYITMINRGTITLTKGDQLLMGSLNIKTSDKDAFPDSQKRFYLWKEIAVDSIGPKEGNDIIIH